MDIGTFWVRALIARRDGDRVHILGRGRRAIEREHLWAVAESGEIENLRALSLLCDDVLCEAEDATVDVQGHKIVPDVGYLVLPAGWLCGAAGTGTASRVALETAIQSEEFIDPVVRGGRRALRDLGRETSGGQWTLVDATLVAFGIDGRRVTDPVGLRGYELEATVFVAAARERLVCSLRTLADVLQLDPPRLVAEPLALAASAPGDGLIVRVGAYTTGLCLTRYGAPVATGSVPLGGQNWTQALADVFKFTLARAEALKLAYSAGKLNAEVADAVGKALSYSIQSWLLAVMEELRSWKVTENWMPEIYVCGGASEMPDVRRAISSVRWLDRVPFPYTPHVQRWEGFALPRVLDPASARRDPGEALLLSAAAWVANERGPQTPDGVLRASLGIG